MLLLRRGKAGIGWRLVHGKGGRKAGLEAAAAPWRGALALGEHGKGIRGDGGVDVDLDGGEVHVGGRGRGGRGKGWE